MRNGVEPKIKQIMNLAEKLPYFSFDDLTAVARDKTYLKILFSRYEKAGKLIRLKKGLYTTQAYIDEIQKSRAISFYGEFLTGILYQPSYLSLEYILYQYNLLTEIPVNFTAMTKKKTAHFSNKFGNFFYHKIKDEFFYGFETIKEGNFIIYKATKAKALFDFLYLRKNLLVNKKAFLELRLNQQILTKDDLKELKTYIKHDGSKKMGELFNYLIH